MNHEKIVGVIGGMGPEATAEFFALTVRSTKGLKDQDHLHIIIDNNPKIPSRTEAILSEGVSPLPMLIESAHLLEKAGAEILVMPSIAAHFFYKDLQKAVNLPIINMIEETMKFIQKNYTYIDTIGLIATSGTLQSNLFDDACQQKNLKILKPTLEVQKLKVMESVYGDRGVKAVGPNDNARILAREGAWTLIDKGARAIIAGCSEITLLLKEGDLPVPIVNPLIILVDKVIEVAKGREEYERKVA